MTLEGVLLLLTGKVLKWNEIIKKMVQSGFIKEILELDVDKVKSKIKK